MKFKKRNNKFNNYKDKKRDDFETNYEEEVLRNPTKWYEEVPEDPAEFKPVTDQQLIELKDEAKKLLDAETLAHSTKNAKTNKSSDYQWIKTVLARGTSSDKIAAFTILIQDNPVFNLKSIQDLVGMVKVSKKQECLTVIQTLSELFLQDLLKPDVKLKSFHQRPLSMLTELTSGNIITKKRRLILWYFEDQLKETYTTFVQALTKAAHDTVDATKEKAINAMYHLLSEHPEQEKNLLINIVNKLGDPSQKVAAKTIFCLGQLLHKHPNMKDIVLTEIEKLLFRSNVSHKAQYYSICFLSQYFLTHEDTEVAKHLITVYFAFFKSCVKKDEINSRMMSALLMGVNRAYPYAKLELNQVNEHIDTIYKVVHQANFNVGLHALTLLFQVCDLRNSVNDRFYSALYRKMFDPNINVTTHQALFLNLIFKAIKKDENIERINVLIKRLLQIALNTSVAMACGILYTISQLCRLKKHKLLLLNRNSNSFKQEQDSRNAETIDDILARQKTNQESSEQSTEANSQLSAEKISEDNSLLVNTETLATNAIDQIVKQEMEQEKKHTRVDHYDAHLRNPLYAGGEFCVHSELSLLQEHFHPSIALFSKNLVNGQKIEYSGDPLKDFTLIRFLDRFVFKNPKKIENDENPKKSGYHFKFGQRKAYVPVGVRSIPVTSSNYLKEAESKIPVDELFMYRFLQKKIQNKKEKPEEADEEDDAASDHESVNSDEFNEMLDQMVGKKKGDAASDDEDDVDFMNELGDALKAPKTKSKRKASDDEDESDDEQTSLIDEQDEDGFDEDNDDELGFDSDDDAADGLNLDDDDDDEFDVEEPSTSKKKSKKTDDITSAFASAEEFALMLEKTGSSKIKHGTSNAMFNDDKSDEKQMAWEQRRNQWISGFNSALGKKKKSRNVSIPAKGEKRKQSNQIQKGKKKIKKK